MKSLKSFKKAFVLNKNGVVFLTILENNKNLSVGILFALFISSLCYTSFSFKKNLSNSSEIKVVIEPIHAFDLDPPYSSLNETVVLIIENSLWGISAVQTAVNQYEQDLKDTGYTTIKHTNSISTVQNLKNLLLSWYTNNNSVGTVLIGNLPYAQYYHPAGGGLLPKHLYVIYISWIWMVIGGILILMVCTINIMPLLGQIFVLKSMWGELMLRIGF